MTEYISDMDTDKISLTKKEKLSRHLIADLNPEALFADGFDGALIGYDSDGFCAVYDYDKCMGILTKKNEMDDQEAHEYMEFNVVSAYVGDFTPMFIHTF